MNKSIWLLALALSLGSVACDGSGSAPTSSTCGLKADAGGEEAAGLSNGATLVIAGVWESSYGGNEVIDDQLWKTPYGTSSVAWFDNQAKTVIIQSSDDAEYLPGTYSKIIWDEVFSTAQEGFTFDALHFCTVSYGHSSVALAKASTATADSTDLDGKGCQGFPWTRLTSVATQGSWVTNFCGLEHIGRFGWGDAWLRGFDNAKRQAYTQNRDDADYAPGRFNKLAWTESKGGKWYYCIVDFDLASLEDAKSSVKTADASEPSQAGCGGFAWTEMSR